MFGGDGLRGLTKLPGKRTSVWVRFPRGQDPPTCNLKISIKIFDLSEIHSLKIFFILKAECFNL